MKPASYKDGLDSMRARIHGLLDGEAECYRRLAEVEALKMVLNPMPQGDLLVRQHLLRAESFKAAAALAGGAE